MDNNSILILAHSNLSNLDLNGQENMKTTNNLPAEMLLKILGNYLTHTGKLIARLVCTGWNRQVLSILRKTAYFAVMSAEAHQAWMISNVEWTKIKICGTEFPAIPEKTKNSVTTLSIQRRDLFECMELAVIFPRLTELHLNITAAGNNVVDANQELADMFKKTVGQLKILSISANTQIFSKFLKQFDSETLCLSDLTAKLKGSVSSDDGTLSELHRIIFKSCKTLKHLDLKIGAEFLKLIVNLCDLKELKLETLLNDTGFNWTENDKKDQAENFLIHQNFLKSQGGSIKNITLPWSSDPDICTEIIRALPKDIETLLDVHAEHVEAMNELSLFPQYTKLRMLISSNAVPTFNEDTCPSLQRLDLLYVEELESTYLHVPNDDRDVFYTSLCNAFVNLVELRILDGFQFYDWNLQEIINGVENLRILHIEDDQYRIITDFGLTGIYEEYKEESMESRQLYLRRDVPNEKRHGLPLSSLKKLEKLVLIGCSVSDFGTYHGLQFGPALKEITLHIADEISDWGLHWLGAGNPGLESFNGSFSSKCISSEGAAILKEQLPLVKDTQKFKLKNIK